MSRTRLTTPVRLASLVATLLIASPAAAAVVTNLQALFHDGQTFLTWDNLAGPGWLYHVFSSSVPLVDATSLDAALEVAQVGTNSGVDQRLSSLVGQTYTYRIAENLPPLPATRATGLRILNCVVQ